MKGRKFIKTIPMKLYLLLLGIIVFSFFSNDFGLVDIQKTAIILAAGIDKTENGFSLTAQIAVPKGVERSTGGTSSVEIEAEGVTVSDCVSKIFAKTGWVPKLVFCDLIVLGEEAVKEDVISYLNYFLRNEYMNDSCRLAVCEGKARDLISSKSAIDDTSSMAIQKLFSDAAENAGSVMRNTIKDFAIGYYGKSKSSYLPFIRATKQKNSDDGEQSSSGGSSGSSGGSEDGSQEDEKIYTADETALFSEGRMVALLPPDLTFAFALLERKLETGTFNTDEDGKPVTLSILKTDGNVSLNMKGAPKVELKIDLTVRLCCRGTTAPMEDIAGDAVKPETLENAKKILTEHIQALWNKGKESGCDLFELKKKLYRSSPKKYEEWKDYLPSAVEAEIDAQVKSMN